MIRVMMKMAAVSAVSVLLLCSSVSAATGDCNLLSAVKKNVTVPLSYTLKDSNRLNWMHGNGKIFDRIGSSKILTGKEGDVTANGSLKLTHADKSKQGEYTVEVFEGGRSQYKQSIRLCLMDPVPEPKVKTECPKPSTVKFTCNVKDAKNVKFKWFHNNIVLAKEELQTLQLKEGDEKWKDVKTDTFSCEVSNNVSSMTSAAVTQSCVKPKPLFPEKLWGINTWIIVGVGGGVVVVLIIIIIICCCRNQRKKHLQLKDEEELRLGWSNPNQQHHHNQHNHPPDPHQHHHHHHHHHQQPAGHTGPRQHRPKQQRNQQRPRAPDVPNGHPQPSPRRPAQAPRPPDKADDEQPPPLPQPRKKAPKTPRA